LAGEVVMTLPPISFEFFPPKTPEGGVKLRSVRDALGALAPEYFSVTYGAGGSTQAGTRATILEIQAAGYAAAPHLSCIGATRESIRSILDDYRQHGIRRLVALRGDLPSGYGLGGEFRYASDLVRFVRESTGDWFNIEVAAYPEVHPQARRAADDLAHFKTKVDAGANAAITQYFYNADAYFHFVDMAARAGVDVPIIPGIMPITNFAQLARFSDACGAEIPRWIRYRLEGYLDDAAAIRAFGIEVVTRLCTQLIRGGAPGLHFYTMNQSQATLDICEQLKAT
jgi:methylenetetrahydrofolate reductase (NADPH)